MDLRVLRLYYFTAFGAFGLYLPYFPTWLESHGFVGVKMSVLTALLPIMSLASPPLVGMLADGLGLRGRMIRIAALFTALGVSALALFAGWLAPLPFPVAFGCFVLFATFRTPMVGLADVLAMEHPADYGRTRLFGSAGFVTAALVGGFFVDATHPYLVPLSVALGLWLAVGVSYFLPATSNLPPRPALADAKKLVAQVGYRQLLVTVALVFMAMSAYDLCASLRLRDLGATPRDIGFFWATATGSEILALYFGAPLVLRFGPGRMLTVAALVAALRWAFIGSTSSLALLLLSQPLHAIAFGLMWTSAVATLKREAEGLGMATAQGVFSAALAVGNASGLLLWGVIYRSHGGSTVFYLASGIAALATVSAFRLIRPLPPRPITPIDTPRPDVAE